MRKISIIAATAGALLAVSSAAYAEQAQPHGRAAEAIAKLRPFCGKPNRKGMRECSAVMRATKGGRVRVTRVIFLHGDGCLYTQDDPLNSVDPARYDTLQFSGPRTEEAKRWRAEIRR